MKLAQRLAVGYIRAKFRVLTTISKRKAAEKAFELFCTPPTRNKRKIPKIFETGEKIAFVLDDGIVRGWRFNYPAERKVLICHGFESSAINFDRYIKPLVKKGYEVLAFDAPGHGRSGGKKITAPLYKDMILAIHKNYGPVRSFMAHSFGGLALSLALEEIPHQSDYRVALIAPATETTTAINSFFKFLQLDEAIRPEFEKIIEKSGGVPSEWYSIGRAMNNIKAQIRWFHDENDDTTPISDVLKVKAENHPNIEFVFTNGLGHRRIYRDNKVSRSVIEFL